jgi:molybdopterin molybdotransferase
MQKQLATILAESDLVLLSGGVSMGKLDYVPQVLTELGVKKLLHRVAQRPGKPLWVGRTRSTMVFGLPGNPISSIVGLLAHVNPFLRKNMWQNEELLITAQLAESFNFKPELTLFQLVSSTMVDGVMKAIPITNAGSGDATSLLRGNGFIQLPAERAQFEADEVFPFISLLP